MKRSRLHGLVAPERRRLGLEVLEQRRLLAINLLGYGVAVAEGPQQMTGGLVENLANSNPVIGAVSAIATSPSDANLVYVGTVDGGIWKTTDAADGNPNWTPQTDALPSLSIGAISFSPAFANAAQTYDPSQTLYAGIGNFTSSAFKSTAGIGGVLRTTDGGTKWTLVDHGFFKDRSLQITSIVPTASSTDGTVDTQVLLAAVLDLNRTDGVDQGGIYRSTDGGGTWSNISTDSNPASGTGTGLPRGSASDLVVDPGNAQQFYAAVPGQGIYRSTDDGALWTQVNQNGIPDTLISASTRIKLAASAAATNLVYAAIVETPQTTLSLTASAGSSTLSVPPKDIQQFQLGDTLFQPGDTLSIDKVPAKTTLTKPTIAGDKVVFVADASAFLVGGAIAIPDGPHAETSFHFIKEVNGNKLTLTAGLSNPHDMNEVIQGVGEQSTVASVDPSGTIHLVHPLRATHPSGALVNIAGQRLAGLFRSDDAGTSWSNLSLPETIEHLHGDVTTSASFGINPGGQGRTNLSLVADPKDANLIYVGGDRQPGDDEEGVSFPNADGSTSFSARLFSGVYDTNAASGPSSMTWTPIVGSSTGKTAPHPDSRAMIIDANGRLLEADDGGLYVLDLTLATPAWASLNGNLAITEMYSVAYDSLNDVVFSGNQDNGSTQQVAAGSLDWSTVHIGDGIGQAVDNSSATQTIRYSMGNDVSRFYRSTYDANNKIVTTVQVRLSDGGALLAGLDGADQGSNGLIPYVLNTVNPSRLLIGNDQLYESPDHGDTIQTVPEEHAPSDPIGALAYGGAGVDATGIHPADVIYAARGNMIGVSTAAAPRTPLQYVTVPGAGVINHITLDPTNWKTAYAVDSNNVFVTTDGGKNWKSIGDALATQHMNLQTVVAFSFDATDGSHHTVVLVGGNQGVLRALDPDPATQTFFTNPWTNFLPDLPHALVTDMHYVPAAAPGDPHHGDLLVIGTLGRGAWEVLNVSASLENPNVLKITGSGGSDKILLVRQADDPSLLDVFVNNTTSTPDFSVPLAALQRIDINGTTGNDTLTLDDANGLISVPAFIHFDGGAAGNVLQLNNTNGLTDAFAGPPDAQGGGTSVLFADAASQIVIYSHVSQAIDPTASPLVDPLSPLREGLVHAADAIQLDDAGLLGSQLAVLGPSLGQAISGAVDSTLAPTDDPVGVAGAAPQHPGNPGSGIVRRLIESGLGAFNLDDIGDGIDSASALRDKLDALDSVPGNVTLTETATETRFDVHIQKTVSGTADLNVDESALGGSISLHGQLDVSADISLHLVFGVDAHGFFIDTTQTDPELVINNLHVSGDVTGAGSIGFLGVTLTGGTITFDPADSLSISLHEPGPDPFTNVTSGLIRPYELDALPTSFATAQIQGGTSGKDAVLDGNFQVGAVLPGGTAPFDLLDAELSLKWANIADP
ncbi:MAG TPA: hypothetical protein VGX78_03515, partial [Pirellulales bacterium]|nr:hypothetical protein [Pirellulales bacterium]